jgi:hypothetical protein
MFVTGERPLAVFVGHVFAENPKSVPTWFAELREGSEEQLRFLALAIWFSRVPDWESYLKRLDTGSSARMTEYVADLRRTRSWDIHSSSFDNRTEQFMVSEAFFATGDEGYVLDAIRSLDPDRSAGARTAAQHWLLDNAKFHSAIVEVCRAEIARQPAAVAALLTDIVREAEMARCT